MLVAVVAVVLFAVGVEAFVRRDLGATSAVPTPSLPRALVGLRGPVGRATGESLPTASRWGIGIGLFGLVIAGPAGVRRAARLVARVHASCSRRSSRASTSRPSAASSSSLFVEFGLILAGLAAATLVADWASDETSGRLEMLLATPLAPAALGRSRGGVGVLARDVVDDRVARGIGIAIGAAITGGDIARRCSGRSSLGLYAAALAGIGIAVGGLIRRRRRRRRPWRS